MPLVPNRAIPCLPCVPVCLPGGGLHLRQDVERIRAEPAAVHQGEDLHVPARLNPNRFVMRVQTTSTVNAVVV